METAVLDTWRTEDKRVVLEEVERLLQKNPSGRIRLSFDGDGNAKLKMLTTDGARRRQRLAEIEAGLAAMGLAPRLRNPRDWRRAKLRDHERYLQAHGLL